MWSVPLVSVAKLRRAVVNAGPSDQLSLTGSYTSTSLDGLGETLPPPMTHIWGGFLKVSARVSPVALGMGAIDPMVFATGSKLNELVVSITRPPEKSDAPAR